jgi:hypothetical protein
MVQICAGKAPFAGPFVFSPNIVDVGAPSAPRTAMAEFYVYELVDPRDGVVFYVGKGKGGRIRQHVSAVRHNREANAAKAMRIREIEAECFKVIERKIFEALTEPEAFRLERQRIAEHGLSKLTNVTRGELTALERYKLSAKAALAGLKPHDQWLAERARSEIEIRLANKVRSELTDIAANGYPSEIIAGPNGLEFR